MAIEKNQWLEEQKRVDHVVDVIDEKAKALTQSTEGLKGDIIGLRKNFWEDVTVNIDEPDDIIESHASIKQQSEMLAERERSHKQYYKELKTLERLKENPYFGRIDFKEESEDKAESIYLGIASLMDEKNEDFLIYDWRAPISSLYYDFSPGEAEYQTPESKIKGIMELKRQFIIRSSQIKGVFDTGVTIGDELLQEVLGHHSDTQMKSIVATIQKEQNQIIRDDKSPLLIVQGAAGSGKTSAALQRVAYLLYRYRETLTASNILLFSPNPLFNSYVASVLPELGEENMEQTTFYHYLDSQIGEALAVEDPFQQIEYTLSLDESDPNYKVRMAGIKLKSSLNFKTLMDDYLTRLATEGMRFKNIVFRDKTLISAHAISDYFYSLDPHQSIATRIENVQQWLIKALRKHAKRERTQVWVEEEIELLSKEAYLKAFQELEETYGNREDSFDDHEREQQWLSQYIVRRHFKPLMRKIKQLKFIHLSALYQQLFEMMKVDTEASWEQIAAQSIEHIQSHQLYFEDAAPFVYLKSHLIKQSHHASIRHIFLDEAQDYTPFQLALLKAAFPKSRWTVLGDFNQAIYPQTTNVHALFAEERYQLGTTQRILLNKSYRSTFEITQFTSPIVNQEDRIEAFNRHGEFPTLTFGTAESQQSLIKERVRMIEAKGYETIALITKTALESDRLYQAFKGELPVRMMTKKTSHFEKGLVILPAYLAKGIEFDAVIVTNASRTHYEREEERKLFYTACTRAMHELHLISIGEKSHFLDRVPNARYHVYT
ncbi:helicase IV [Pullulanibacillus camelliae]|uniref:Helicase IV n=1 Tax=Pullulanibacillus camelliae TaxID=1707096 RepID=A0A8J2VNB8_9BACL|nr:RNA polymerase recycling motor HelD [Pullulanibacillus camelliae]GGE39842.1 helicase IV [Pullulanibacillus camelliae]